MNLLSILQKHFHYQTFREGQEAVITSVLSGHNTLAMLPTGTGKSLCYQLPGYILDGQVLIVSPLLSLMQDQVEQMKMKGEKRVIAINSFLTPQQKKRVLENIRLYKYIFISPEMLGMENIVNVLFHQTISLFVIDEAHCISQWGYDFRPDYLKLGEIRKKIGNPVTLALTATATPEVRNDIQTSLQIESCKEVIYSVDRPNIFISIEKVAEHKDKIERLKQLVLELKGPGIIYFSSKKLAEQIASYLQTNERQNVMAYHGGMEQEQRILIQQQFLNGQLDIICATSAFGMGINKENIRFVIHYHMPLQLESYLQEIGRAGRDGKQSIAILLYVPGDEALAFNIVESELPQTEQIEYLATLTNHQSGPTFLVHDDWIRNAGFTETQSRIVRDYLSWAFKNRIEQPFQSLIKYVENRLAIKRAKIASMTTYIHGDSCRRKMILNYFAEEGNDRGREKYCCDYCGLDMKPFLKDNRLDSHQNPNNDEIFDWQLILSKFLLNE